VSSEPRDVEGGGRRGKDDLISLSPGMQTGVTKTRKVLRVEPAMRRGAKLSGASC